MRTLEYTFWQDGEFYICHLNEFPDHETQGFSKDDLIEHLKDLLVDFKANQIPIVRKVEERVLS